MPIYRGDYLKRGGLDRFKGGGLARSRWGVEGEGVDTPMPTMY